MMCFYTLLVCFSLLTGSAQSISENLINRISPPSTSTIISSQDAQHGDLFEITEISRPDQSGRIIRRTTAKPIKKPSAAASKNPILSEKPQHDRKSKSQVSAKQSSSKPDAQTKIKSPSSSPTRSRGTPAGPNSGPLRGVVKPSSSASRSSAKHLPKGSREEELRATQNKLNSLSLNTKSKTPQKPTQGSNPGGKNSGKLPPGSKQSAEVVWAAGQAVGPARVTLGNTRGTAGRNISPNRILNTGVADRHTASIEAAPQHGGGARVFAYGKEVRLSVDPHNNRGQGYLATVSDEGLVFDTLPPGESVVSWTQGQRAGTNVFGMAGLHGKGTVSAEATLGDRAPDPRTNRYR